MLGQPASWQTVCSPSRLTRACSSVYSGPIRARVLIHGGLRSIGVSALRASRRSIRRPSGGATLTSRAYADEASGDRGRLMREAVDERGQVAFDDRQQLVDGHVAAE